GGAEGGAGWGWWRDGRGVVAGGGPGRFVFSSQPALLRVNTIHLRRRSQHKPTSVSFDAAKFGRGVPIAGDASALRDAHTKERGLTMFDLDLVLAILHHLLVFALFAVLFAEFLTVRRGMDAPAVTRVQMIDAWYGVLAALILIIGFSRAVFAAKGWEYYAHNSFFWAKIGTFVVIGLLSIPPTLAFLR